MSNGLPQAKTDSYGDTYYEIAYNGKPMRCYATEETTADGSTCTEFYLTGINEALNDPKTKTIRSFNVTLMGECEQLPEDMFVFQWYYQTLTNFELVATLTNAGLIEQAGFAIKVPGWKPPADVYRWLGEINKERSPV